MAEIEFDNRLRPGGRRPVLWIVHRGTIHKFDGGNIPGVVAVEGSLYTKQGKWSFTKYWIQLADGATACQLLAKLHQKVWPGNSRWDAYGYFMRQFGVSVSFEEFDAALSRDFPKERQRMLEGEEALEFLDEEEEAAEAELVEISTSQLSRRTPHSDVRVTAEDGATWVLAHEAPVGTKVPGVCKVVDSKHTPGFRGGVTTLSLAVATGVSVALEPYARDSEPNPEAVGRR